MTDNDSLWRTVRGSPLGLLRSWWPWRSLAYVISSMVIMLVVLLLVPFTILFPPALIFVGLTVGALERRRLRWVMGLPVADPHIVPPPGLGAWLRRRVSETATWRELAYTLVTIFAFPVVGFVSLTVLAVLWSIVLTPFLVSFESPIMFGGLIIDSPGEALAFALGLGPLAIVFGIYLMSVVGGAEAAFAQWLLAPSEAETRSKMEELTSSRTRLVAGFETERRRIERDLHDGAQQHLVLLSLTLGLAELELGDDNSELAALVAEAHRQARQASTAIRDLVHGVHPQVLTDLGLAAAADELAERCLVPVTIDFQLSRRLPTPVESTAYFVVAEALANVTRHSHASRVEVTGRLQGQRLTLTIVDDGQGGADPARGSGLNGLADRASVLGGTLVVTSPVGGPTTLRMDVPCPCD